MRTRIVLPAILMFLAGLFVPPRAEAACEMCKGHFTNRSCQAVSTGDSGYSDCRNDFFGNCINGSTACTGSSCGTGSGCEEEHQGARLQTPLAPEGVVLAEPLDRCRVAGVIIEA